MNAANYYRYGCSISNKVAIDGQIIVYYRGQKYEVPNNDIEFSSVDQLTIEEVAEAFKGTNGIIALKGDFKTTPIVRKFDKIKII